MYLCNCMDNMHVVVLYQISYSSNSTIAAKESILICSRLILAPIGFHLGS
jgi:hypothetical protein